MSPCHNFIKDTEFGDFIHSMYCMHPSTIGTYPLAGIIICVEFPVYNYDRALNQ
jgi:hypothetical protein